MAQPKDIYDLRSQLGLEVDRFWEAKIDARASEIIEADKAIIDGTSPLARILEIGKIVKVGIIEQYGRKIRRERAASYIRPFLKKPTVDVAFDINYRTMREISELGLASPIINLASCTDTVEVGWQAIVPAHAIERFEGTDREPRIDEAVARAASPLKVYFAAKDKETGVEARRLHYSVDFGRSTAIAYRQGPELSYEPTEESYLALQGILQSAQALFQ